MGDPLYDVKPVMRVLRYAFNNNSAANQARQIVLRELQNKPSPEYAVELCRIATELARKNPFHMAEHMSLLIAMIGAPIHPILRDAILLDVISLTKKPEYFSEETLQVTYALRSLNIRQNLVGLWMNANLKRKSLLLLAINHLMDRPGLAQKLFRDETYLSKEDQQILVMQLTTHNKEQLSVFLVQMEILSKIPDLSGLAYATPPFTLLRVIHVGIASGCNP
ncbi:hypothetical protein HDU96_007367 [Phlyctochytrium bullatum]|nr:hypothetical protein HDU96_007367 [Phlyctochytrium bullatum]